MRITISENQVAILNLEALEVEILTIIDMNKIDDIEQHLSNLGYSKKSIKYMTWPVK